MSKPNSFFALSQTIGWPHTLQEWRLMNKVSEALFAQDANGLYATTLVTSYDAMATIGMVLVAPNYRRLGTGTALVKAALRKATEEGAERITLTSSASITDLYSKIGFSPIGSVLVLSRAGTGLPSRPCVALPRAEKLSSILAEQFYDGCARRQRLLCAFLRQKDGAFAIRKRGAEILGFAGSVRRAPQNGQETHAIGPVLAQTAEDAVQLIQDIAAQTNAGVTCFLYQDMAGAPNETNKKRHGAAQSLQAQGFAIKDTLPVMSFEGRPVPLYTKEALFSPITLAFG